MLQSHTKCVCTHPHTPFWRHTSKKTHKCISVSRYGVCVCVCVLFLLSFVFCCCCCFFVFALFCFSGRKVPIKNKTKTTKKKPNKQTNSITQSVNWCEKFDALLKYYSVTKDIKRMLNVSYGIKKIEYSCWTNFSATSHHNLTKMKA